MDRIDLSGGTLTLKKKQKAERTKKKRSQVVDRFRCWMSTESRSRLLTLWGKYTQVTSKGPMAERLNNCTFLGISLTGETVGVIATYTTFFDNREKKKKKNSPERSVLPGETLSSRSRKLLPARTIDKLGEGNTAAVIWEHSQPSRPQWETQSQSQ